MKGPIIAERVLFYMENPKQKLTVKLAKPKLNAKSGAYECSFQIAGESLNLARSCEGLDSFQALQLAFVMIGVEIAAIEKASGHHLRFGDLEHSGFPRA